MSAAVVFAQIEGVRPEDPPFVAGWADALVGVFSLVGWLVFFVAVAVFLVALASTTGWIHSRYPRREVPMMIGSAVVAFVMLRLIF